MLAIEGFHDAVRIYTPTILPSLLVSFFVQRGMMKKPKKKKKKKTAWTFDLLRENFKNFNKVCVLIFLSLSSNLVLCYELNKK